MSRAAPRAALAALALVAAAAAARAGPAAPAPAAPPRPAPRSGAAGPDAAAAREGLVQAYQKEYAFLAAEEAALRGRLAEVEADRAARVTSATTALAALEERLRALRAEADAGRAELAALDARRQGLAEGKDALAALLAQAEAALPGREAAPPGDDPAARVAAVERAFVDATATLRRRATIRRAPGTFFLADGAEARGDVLWVGEVAALGVAPAGAGTLAPAGGGALQVWSAAGADAARAALAGRLPAVLPAYVFEALDKPVARSTEETLYQHLQKGGLVGWVIVGLGLVAVTLAVARALLLLALSGAPDPVLDAVAPLVLAGRRDEALARARARRGAAARVVAAVLPHLDAGQERLESAASDAMLQEALRLERFEAALLVSASVAPLLGLLGTVTGMISTFDIITVYGTGDPKLLAGGISEALVTTEQGLVVAIPALLLGNLLGGWAERLRAGLERAALRTSLLAAAAPPAAPAEAPRAEAALAEVAA